MSPGLKCASIVSLNADQHPLRILQIINDVGMGGGEHYVLRLARLLKKHRIRVACTCKPGYQFHQILDSAGICAFPIDLSPVVIGSIIKLKQFIKSNRIDLLHAHGPTGAFYGRIAALLSFKPIITTYHIAISRITDIPKWKRMIFVLADRIMSSIDRKIFVVSEALRNELIQLAKFPDAKIKVLYTGLNTDLYGTLSRMESRRRLNLHPEDRVVGYIGRMSHEKGVHILLEALRVFAKDKGKIIAVLVGDGPYLKMLIEQVSTMGIADICRFLGHRQDVPDILPAFDLLALPSLTEGLPQILLEAMASGIPVVASIGGGIPEAVCNEITGFLVPPQNPAALADAFKNVFFDLSKSRQIGIAGQKIVKQKFTADRMAIDMISAYGSMIPRMIRRT